MKVCPKTFLTLIEMALLPHSRNQSKIKLQGYLFILVNCLYRILQIWNLLGGVVKSLEENFTITLLKLGFRCLYKNPLDYRKSPHRKTRPRGTSRIQFILFVYFAYMLYIYAAMSVV